MAAMGLSLCLLAACLVTTRAQTIPNSAVMIDMVQNNPVRWSSVVPAAAAHGSTAALTTLTPR
jgi:hypothetical protein